MRKTEVVLGLFAGTSGIALSVLSMLMILPYSAQSIKTLSTEMIFAYGVVCLIANGVGIAGAMVVPKNHVLGSIIMGAAVITVLCFGFPWQSISAVFFIISVVLAVVPVRMGT